MKKLFAGTILLASFAFTLPSFAQKGAHPNVSCDDCDDPPDPGDPGPGGGDPGPHVISPTPGNPYLNWVNQGNPNYNVSVGGVPQREKVGAAINQQNGVLYVAIASNTNDDGNGNHVIRLYTNTDGTSNLNFIGNVTLQLSNGAATQYTTSNPELVYMNGNLYIAFTSGYGVYVGRYLGGSNFQTIGQLGTSYSGPGLAADSANNRIYVSFLDGNLDHQAYNDLILYSLDLNGNILTYGSFSNAQLAFDPGMVIYNGLLFISAQKYSSHNLALYETSDGRNIYESTAAANDQTSTTPSLVVHNNYLYIGFRTNDGDHKFLYKYTTDGGNWTTVDPHYQMGGPPTLVNNDTQGSVNQYQPNLPNQLFNAFAQDQGGRYYTLAHTE